jgi:hypothetical protein
MAAQAARCGGECPAIHTLALFVPGHGVWVNTPIKAVQRYDIGIHVHKQILLQCMLYVVAVAVAVLALDGDYNFEKTRMYKPGNTAMRTTRGRVQYYARMHA